jgi:hypothetical protein
VVASHIPQFVGYILSVIKLLVFGKPLSGIRPIIVGAALYHLINTLYVYSFVTCFFFPACHFISLAWQLRLVTK